MTTHLTIAGIVIVTMFVIIVTFVALHVFLFWTEWKENTRRVLRCVWLWLQDFFLSGVANAIVACFTALIMALMILLMGAVLVIGTLGFVIGGVAYALTGIAKAGRNLVIRLTQKRKNV